MKNPNAKIKVCHVSCNISQSYFLEAVADSADKDKYDLDFVFLNPAPPALYNKFAERGFPVKWIKFTARTNLPLIVWRLRKFFAETRPDIVHTHLVDASLAGLTAAKLNGIKKRVHTRHHGNECHTYYKHGVYYDKVINSLSKRIMAITGVVAKTLITLENVAPEKVSMINYGYNFAHFATDAETTKQIREKYRLKEGNPIVGVISRFVHGKGIQYIIPAFAELTKKYPQAKLVLANAVGNYTPEIKELLQTNLKPEQYVLIEFEAKVFDLYKTFDVFVHAPVSSDYEAFGQTYVEPLYLGIPSVFTISGVANDFIRDGENAVVVPHCDSQAICRGLELIMENTALRKKIIEQGKIDVEKLFNADILAKKLDEFYALL